MSGYRLTQTSLLGAPTGPSHNLGGGDVRIGVVGEIYFIHMHLVLFQGLVLINSISPPPNINNIYMYIYVASPAGGSVNQRLE